MKRPPYSGRLRRRRRPRPAAGRKLTLPLLEELIPTELPIACSLSASELPARLAQIAQLGRDALVDVELSGTYATLRFAAGAGVRERVTSVVAAESACCAFVAMKVSDKPDAVVLDITAPEDAELVLHELVDAFRGEPQAA
jgi:hypothetical protein